ncbi:class I adenylate-forming enzyme family protein [Cryptosporangium aurantiacum]|uniref:Bile acid-coenzyme A ligase n=1 Tax=Cryptosporangium aurantiacum TaxID=134849 RepID=A0A1M7RGH7_9ACTN|nr:AMP-binding protein [Cryptosporangium aurantiacum]SHN45249.1 bile acid-coenzyme A ligase [Cryptosporangium aurantiacum]
MSVEISIARRIASLAAERPSGTALRVLCLDGSEPTFTWPELHDRSSRLAGAFADRGLAHGDRLGIGLRNSPEFVLSVLAAWKLGAVPVPVRWDVPDWELERLREVIAPRLYLGPDDLSWLSTPGPAPDLPDVVSPQLNGICSSGSTGTPKVIVSDRPGYYSPLLASPLADAWGPVPRPQTILVPAPMYHTNGFAPLHNLLAGDQLIVCEKFDATRIADAIERLRVTNFTATPTMLKRIADLPGIDAADLASLVWITQGAAPMPASLVHRWAGLVGAEKIYMAYGMTEGLGLTAIRGDEWMTHQGTVGRGIRGTEVRILDSDGAEQPPGAIGEIYLRSSFPASSHYLGPVPQLKETADGFKTAGDLGFLDEDGYLHLVDRRVDMIITGGANVYPAEVEAALIDHPGVADVVVIGLRDPEWGRRVHAIIQPSDASAPPETGEIIAYAKSRIAAYKVPKTVEIVDAVPRSEATKVNRGALVAAREA